MANAACGQPPRRGRRQRAVGAQLGEDRVVVGRVDHDADVGVVLGRGAHHRRPADVDQLDARIGVERVEVDHQRGRSARCRSVARSALVLRVVGSASMPPWTSGCSVTTRWPRIAGNPVRSATSVTGSPASAIAARRPAARQQSPAQRRAAPWPARRHRSCRRRTAARWARRGGYRTLRRCASDGRSLGPVERWTTVIPTAAAAERSRRCSGSQQVQGLRLADRSVERSAS